MNWSLLTRGLLFYSAVAGGGTVVAVVLLLGTGLGPLVTFAIGLVGVLFVACGGGDVRAGTMMTNADADGLRTGIVDPGDGMARPIGADLKIGFDAVGHLVFSVVAAVASTVV